MNGQWEAISGLCIRDACDLGESWGSEIVGYLSNETGAFLTHLSVAVLGVYSHLDLNHWLLWCHFGDCGISSRESCKACCFYPFHHWRILFVPTLVLKLQRRKFFKFYWYIIDLQHCDHFCCTAKWFSYANIHISFSYSFLLRFITGYWIQLPVQYSRTLLFIHPVYYGYIFLHLLIPNSQFIPPQQPLSLTEEEIKS